MDFDIGLPGAFVAGILSFLSPCVLPIVPPSLAFIAGVSFNDIQAGDKTARMRVLKAAIFFVLGFVTVFTFMGLSASAIGQFLRDYRDQLAVAAGLVIIVLGLHFLGVFRIALLYREARVQPRGRPLGLWGAYVAGLAFAFGWTPCVGPVLAAILVVAGGQDTALQGGALLLVYALGIGVPFIIAAAFLERFSGFLQRMRPWMGAIEKGIGAFLIITGLLIMTGTMNEIGFWIQENMPWLSRLEELATSSSPGGN